MGKKTPTIFPISICRLLQRLELEENDNCFLTVKDIFDTYKIENALESVENVVRIMKHSLIYLEKFIMAMNSGNQFLAINFHAIP